MIRFFLVIGLSAVFTMLGASVNKSPRASGYHDRVFEHGGGCRKSSPAGQCCHMDRKKGTVHCH